MEKVVTSVLTLAPRVSVQKVEDRSRWVQPASKVKVRSGQGVMWSGCDVVKVWFGQGVAWSKCRVTLFLLLLVFSLFKPQVCVCVCVLSRK